MKPATQVGVDLVERDSGAFEDVLTLYREHRRTLGFLPVGAFEQCADEGRLLAAVIDTRVVGYLAYRVAAREAVLVHLCVAEAHRGKRVAGVLLDELVRDTSELIGIRLLCRSEYEANRLWPQFAFRCVGERVGRGQDRAPLLLWRRLNVDDAPLLSLIQQEGLGARRKVAVDANVFLDFESETDEASESRSLLADWLEPEIAIYVTAELSNEFSRHPEVEVRRLRRAQLTSFPMLEAKGGDLRALVEQLDTLLPKSTTLSDKSDRRQLAHAIAGQADFFVTRDDTLLHHAVSLEQSLGVAVVRPGDLIRRIHSDQDPISYAPARLVGTRIVERAPASEAEILPFQRFGQSEIKSAFLAKCRQVLSQPIRFRTRLISPPGAEATILYSVDQQGPAGEIRLVLLRALGHGLGPTLLRRVLAEQFLMAGVGAVCCDDAGDPIVEEALLELGFVERGHTYVKKTRRGVLPLAVARSLEPTLAASTVPDIERTLWPLKVADGGADSYILPIRPHWAAQLFDAELAERELFGAEHTLALPLENAYYSASPIQIPAGSRILWYVSGAVGQVRACSLCAETVRGRARDLFRRFRRLGVYRWRDILGLAAGDPEGLVTAYRFAFTERFPSPIAWRRLQTLLAAGQGHGNQIAGPVHIADKMFVDLYEEASREPD
ncbi:MAG: GNAT family N-acetyltransferase [Deltaproteobacteria bacterium]|nr:GNAT family N-acetyltransferase [Deltaproteobacteria bacterium]